MFFIKATMTGDRKLWKNLNHIHPVTIEVGAVIPCFYKIEVKPYKKEEDLNANNNVIKESDMLKRLVKPEKLQIKDRNYWIVWISKLLTG